MNYEKIYADFVADRRTKEAAVVTQPHERHHVVPRALGGSDAPENLIAMTLRDHLFAHALMAKIHGGSMWYAHSMMRARITGGSDHGSTMRRLWATEDFKRRVVAGMTASWVGSGRRGQIKKQAESLTRRYASDPAFKDRVCSALKKTRENPEVRAKHGKATSVGMQAAEVKAKLSNAAVIRRAVAAHFSVRYTHVTKALIQQYRDLNVGSPT